jgi:hypothetical protein
MNRRELVQRLRALAVAIESGDSMKDRPDEHLHSESDSVVAVLKMASRLSKAAAAVVPQAAPVAAVVSAAADMAPAVVEGIDIAKQVIDEVTDSKPEEVAK